MEYQSYEKFEYNMLNIPAYNFVHQLDELGESGWELIYIQEIDNGYKTIFKRKILSENINDKN